VNQDKNIESAESNKINKRNLLFKEFSNAIFPLIGTIAAALAMSTLIFDSTIFSNHSAKSSEMDKMFVYLSKGVNGDNFSEEYFNTAFSHFDRKSDGEIGKYGRIEVLEDFIIYLNSEPKNDKSTSITVVNEFLAKTKKVEPFSALPVEERRLMDQLQLYVTDSKGVKPVEQTLNELKQVILARNKEYQKIESQNSWSLPLSFVGVFLTLVFGVWTTILSVKQSRSEYIKKHYQVWSKDENGQYTKTNRHSE
jgi:hypothetical protein